MKIWLLVIAILVLGFLYWILTYNVVTTPSSIQNYKYKEGLTYPGNELEYVDPDYSYEDASNISHGLQ